MASIPHSRRRAFAGLALAATLLLGSCDTAQVSGPAPTPVPVPTPLPLALSCPADLSTRAIGDTEGVTFPTPVAEGGTPPVTVECLPASGSAFPLGTSDVKCAVRDASARSASCTFHVTVAPVPRLSLTRLLAVGDSITYGVSAACPGGSAIFQAGRPAHLADLHLLVADVPHSYPTQLQQLLAQRYTAQSPVVINEGVPGETTGEAKERLSGLLTRHGAEVLLLQEGANNVNSKDPASIPPLVRDLRTMVRTAKNRGVRVFLGTLLPQRTGSCRAYAPTLIEPANAEIRALAAAEGVTLVDLYQPFVEQLGTLLDRDGLHPSVAGYEQMAQTFLDVIQRELER